WQERWEKEGIFNTDLNSRKQSFYNLWMFPYPSAEGLHAGHAYASTGSDIYGRFMRMRGKEVFQPIGYDSFGIHSENFAIKLGEQPRTMLERTTKNYERQLHSLGHGYDWSRTVTTSDEDYYRWTQWLFGQMYKSGLAYRKRAEVNWCPSCKTGLSDEQVIDGECERCGTSVEKRELMQWFFRITRYADRLLANLEKIDWPEKIKIAQRNWIGKSEGMRLKFGDVEVFTTRPDTVHGATFVAVAGLESGIRNQESREKIGKFTGKYVTNPATKKKIPVWEVNYVDEGYGTGAIMGVPAHDARDREFATMYGIDIVEMEPDEKWWKKAEEEGWGKKEVHYHLRDWLISRQRYWGPPIPMVYCEACAEKGDCWFAKNKGECPADWASPGWYPVPEEELPVKLPYIGDYKPEGTGRGPLAKHPEFYETRCPECGGPARRETDVSDTFLDSAWYFLRYPSASLGQVPWDPEITRKWLPVSLYFGGAEHAVLHLMYARFVTMVLFDLKLVDFEEPFPRFFAHGLMIKDGAKMSKSRGNVVNPDQYVEKFGADAFRLYLMFIGPMDGSPDFRDTGMEGMARFMNRLWHLESGSGDAGRELNVLVNGVTEDIQKFRYNTAIAKIMTFVNLVEKSGMTKAQAEIFWRLIAPFAPHLAEELWERLEGKFSVHQQAWPEYDRKLISEEKATVVVQINGKVREKLVIDKEMDSKNVEQLALASDKVKKYIEGRKYRVVFVPGKILNLVIDD
ncbi:leucine--tRNA ligase, partial [Candidatus Amesbacteria bacterium]|nr:leucine--tRNA ligase [Candidatus Amesbacteria bacterium]